MGNDAPFAVAFGACLLSSFVFPAVGGGSHDESDDAVIDSNDTRLAVMSIISFIPYFNWLVCKFEIGMSLFLFFCMNVDFYRSYFHVLLWLIG